MQCNNINVFLPTFSTLLFFYILNQNVFTRKWKHPVANFFTKNQYKFISNVFITKHTLTFLQTLQVGGVNDNLSNQFHKVKKKFWAFDHYLLLPRVQRSYLFWPSKADRNDRKVWVTFSSASYQSRKMSTPRSNKERLKTTSLLFDK